MTRLHSWQEQISQRVCRRSLGLAKMTVTQNVTKMDWVEFESVSNTAHHVYFLNQMCLVHILILLCLSQHRTLLPSELKFCTYNSSLPFDGTYFNHIYHPYNFCWKYYDANPCVISSGFLLLPASSVQIFSVPYILKCLKQWERLWALEF